MSHSGSAVSSQTVSNCGRAARSPLEPLRLLPLEEILDELRERLTPALLRHHVIRVILFGSWARGEATSQSDLDLLLVQETGKRFLDRYEGLLAEVQAALPFAPVDLLVYTPAELAALGGRKLIATALREGRVLYESVEEPSRGSPVVSDR